MQSEWLGDHFCQLSQYPWVYATDSCVSGWCSRSLTIFSWIMGTSVCSPFFKLRWLDIQLGLLLDADAKVNFFLIFLFSVLLNFLRLAQAQLSWRTYFKSCFLLQSFMFFASQSVKWSTLTLLIMLKLLFYKLLHKPVPLDGLLKQFCWACYDQTLCID